MGHVFGTLLVLVIVSVVFVMKCENDFVKTNELLKNSLSAIDVVQENRYDTLVEVYKIVSAYAQHEKSTLTDIVDKRNKITESEMNNLLANVNAIAEAYPQLKADSMYNNLVDNLKDLNMQTKTSKLVYNDTVTKYNRLVQMIPSNFVAMMFSHTMKEYLTVEPMKKDMPHFEK